MSMLGMSNLPAGLLALLLVLVAQPVRAHDFLKGSSPAAGAVVREAPRELTLTFNGPTEPEFTRLRVDGPAGLVPVGRPDFTNGNVVRFPFTDSLVQGRYEVQWRTAGSDGHPVSDVFVFYVVAADAAQPTVDDLIASPVDRSDPFAAFGAILRWFTLLGIVAAVGAVVFRATVLARVSLEDETEVVAHYLPDASHGAARLGLFAAVLLFFSALMRLFLRSVEMDSPAFGPMLAGTNWGKAWLVHTAGVVLSAAGFLAVRRRFNEKTWWVAGAGAAVATAGLALASHASMVATLRLPSVLANLVHTIAAAGWLGNLLAVFVVGIPLAWKLDRTGRWTVIRDVVHAFSPAALLFGGIAVVTGVFMSWTHVGSLAALTGTDYGRILLLKVGMLAVTGLFGAYNWLRVRPALGDETGARRLRRTAGAELAIAALVLAVTAVLVAVPTPRP